MVLRMEDLLTDFFLGMLLAADVAACWRFEGGPAEDDATGTSVVAQGIVQVMLSSSSISPFTNFESVPDLTFFRDFFVRYISRAVADKNRPFVFYGIFFDS